jgi:hypothetical protein
LAAIERHATAVTHPTDQGERVMAAPSHEAQLRLIAAAKLLMAAAAGRVFSVVDAVEGARRIIDRALDAEAGVIDRPLTEDETP